MIMQKNKSDCLTCCIAEIFNLPYRKVPKFYKSMSSDSENWYTEYCAFIKSLGYDIITIPASWDKATKKLKVYELPSVPFVGIGNLKKKNRNYSHAVVLRYANEHVSIDDPKVDSDYRLSDITDIEIFVSSVFSGIQK